MLSKVKVLTACIALSFIVSCSGQTFKSNTDMKIKGNINAHGEKIYHMPGQQFYESTKAEQYFNTEEEAQKSGFRKSKK